MLHLPSWCRFAGLVPLLAAALYVSQTKFGESNKRLVLSLGHAPAASPASCSAIDTSGSPWEQHCLKLSRVCVDQQTLILYEDQYQQVGLRKAGELPSQETAPGRWYGDYMYPWRVGGANRGFEVEAALRREAAARAARGAGAGAGTGPERSTGAGAGAGAAGGASAASRRLLQPAYEVKVGRRDRRCAGSSSRDAAWRRGAWRRARCKAATHLADALRRILLLPPEALPAYRAALPADMPGLVQHLHL